MTPRDRWFRFGVRFEWEWLARVVSFLTILVIALVAYGLLRNL